MKYAACLGGFVGSVVRCVFFFSFVCISQASEKKEENERGKLNWLALGNMGRD